MAAANMLNLDNDMHNGHQEVLGKDILSDNGHP